MYIIFIVMALVIIMLGMTLEDVRQERDDYYEKYYEEADEMKFAKEHMAKHGILATFMKGEKHE